MKKIKIAVIGLGYVGLPLARLLSTKYPTVGFDLNKTTIVTIPERAFDHCRLASTIKLPATVDSIANEAFDNSASNVTIQIPNTESMDI